MRRDWSCQGSRVDRHLLTASSHSDLSHMVGILSRLVALRVSGTGGAEAWR